MIVEFILVIEGKFFDEFWKFEISQIWNEKILKDVSISRYKRIL